MLIIKLAILMIFILIVPVAGAKGGPASFGLIPSFSQFDTVIEQESPNFRQYNCPVTHDPACDSSTWVVRSPALANCFWDADDHESWLMYPSRATIAAKETWSLSVCVVANDPAYGTWAQYAGLSIISSSDSLDVSITSAPDEKPGEYIHILKPSRVGNDIYYQGCLGGPVYTSNSGVTLPDTNGGTGTLSTITFTITNLTSRAAKISAGGALVAQGDYYFQMSSGGFRSNGGYNYYCRHDNPLNVRRPLAPVAWEPVYYYDTQT